MMDDSELLNIFWVEVGEYLQGLNAALLQIEMVPAEDEGYQASVREMNRIAHSMKGAARAVGISVIETISHYMEEVFNSAGHGHLALEPDVCDTLYDGLDLIQNVADGEETNEEALAMVLARLEQIVAVAADDSDSTPAPDPRLESEQMAVFVPDDDPVPDETQLASSANDKKSSDHPTVIVPPFTPDASLGLETNTHTMLLRPAEETVRVTVSKLDRLMAEVTELFVVRMHGEEELRTIDELRQVLNRWQREWRAVRTAYIRLVRRLQDQHQDGGSELPILFRFLESNQRHLAESQRQLTQLVQSVAQENMRLSILVDQLQSDIGGMRMTPFETIVGGFQRMVRDLARDMEKQIHLEITGASVEIDKAVLDALKDPLVHLLRNAIDHGIEMPEDRQHAGKSPIGRIEIVVEQRGSEIVINVSDDGRGIDADRVRRSIVRNRLMTEADAEALNDNEARSYIFYSGLSTNESVTALSGRGLGMDIVRDRVESLRGRVGVQSRVGQGTTIIMNVPVSLTRIRCILLRVGDQRFAVPSAMVLRMDKRQRDDIFTTEGHEMLLMGDRAMLVTSLSNVLGIPTSRSGDDKMSVVALQAADRAIAFEVDELFSEQELVLKPLGPELARARFVSGASLLGTGEVIIMLDANDLVRRASGAVLPRRYIPTIETAAVERPLRVLVVDDSITTRTLEKNILETAGFDVYVAVDGIEAWEMLPQNEFDLIISDVEMPKMDGLELTARIKSSRQYHHIPVILLTSLSKPEQREAGLHAGAEAYLVKSRFDQGELLQTIQAVVHGVTSFS
jgi:two-component system, chemotaxis family, sensor kinase CheA